MSSSVPNLSLDRLVVDDERLGLELNPNRGPGIQAEVVPGETRQELRFPDCRVSNQYDLEHVIDLLIEISVQIRHLSLSVTTKYSP